MTEKQELISTLKAQLKSRGKTYLDVSRYLGVSEASVKRMMSKAEISLTRLEQLCHLLGIQISDLVLAMQAGRQSISQLTYAQEIELVKDVKLILVAGCVINHWPIEFILENYTIPYDEVIQKLVHLDRLHFIELFPNNKYKHRLARNFSWIPQGPMHRYFQKNAQEDFLSSDFDKSQECFALQFGMLSESSTLKLQKKCLALTKELTELHFEDLSTPISEKKMTTLVVALRPWLPAIFNDYRKVKKEA